MWANLLSTTSSLEDYKIILAFIPIFIGMKAIPFSTTKLKVFYSLVCLNAAVVVAGIITSSMGNNIYILYIFAPMEAILFSYILFPEQEKKKARLIVLVIIALAILMNFVEAFFFTGGIAFYNSITYTIINLVLGVLAIRTLLKLRFDPLIYQLTDEPLFWIAISVAIYKFGTLINWAFFRSVQITGDDAIIVMTFLGTLISYLTFVLHSLALWKAKKRKTRSTNLAT